MAEFTGGALELNARSILESEFSAQENSFLLKLRTSLDWDKISFLRLASAMQTYCCNDEDRPRNLVELWVAEGFWYLDYYVKEWSSHKNFPRIHESGYYEAAYEYLHDLAVAFFSNETATEVPMILRNCEHVKKYSRPFSIKIENRRNPLSKLKVRYPNARLVDVTSKATDEFIRFSPFFPIGGIPIPYSNTAFSESVEGIWQGLKVFEKQDIDMASFKNSSMKNLKRTERKLGKCLGHRRGLQGTLLNYLEARRLIYLPSYLWVLENALGNLIQTLREWSDLSDLILLDYSTNCDIEDLSRPLSHANLIKFYIEGEWPGPRCMSK